MANRCSGCEVANINGVRCHETGCPEAWRDYSKDCFICGCEFQPEGRHDVACQDCINPDEWWADDEGIFEDGDDTLHRDCSMNS